jgi:tetratricopeptide (TPR) repeat protein
MPPCRDADLPQTNKIFVDREEPQRIFEKAAMAIPAGGSSLRVFYGVGGQGKTALCRELMRTTAPEVEPSYGFLRRALLDLHGRTKSDPDMLLVWIRNEFAKAGLVAPCFDLALALTWEGTRGEQAFPQLVKPWLGRTTKAAKGGVDEGAEEAGDWLDGDTAAELIGEAIGEIPGLGFVFRKIGHWVIDKGRRLYLELTREHLQRLYRDGDLLPAHELSKLLPWMLAQDLNHHLRENPGERFVLFIDEYERVFDQGGAGARFGEYPFDRHMRDFVKEMNGLLVVFFTRERLPWEEDLDWRPDLEGCQHLLGGLADSDADAFLVALPIADAVIRAAIVEGSRETAAPKAPVYPLMLDLQVEYWRRLTAASAVSAERFRVTAETIEGRFREVVDRVLRDYDAPLQATLERLAFARRFDEATFDHIVTTFGTGLPLDAFERISGLSFVTRSPDGLLSLHGIMANAIRSLQSREKGEETIATLFDHFWSRSKVETHLEITDVKISFLFEAAQFRSLMDPEDYVSWLYQATCPLDDGAFYEPAAALWRDASSKIQNRFGSEYPLIVPCLNNLGASLLYMGDYPTARSSFERALAISEKINGPEHTWTSSCLNNLGLLLSDIGEYSAARPLLERALAISEKIDGPEHPATATCLENLAALMLEIGDASAARPLLERALAISEKASGPVHPLTGRCLNNLANLLQHVGDYVASRPLLERALAISEKTNGPEHPATATCLNNLAVLLTNIGDHVAARPLLERALAISEKINGPEHPETCMRLNDLASLLQTMGDFPAARPLLERALAVFEKAAGAEHPVTGAGLNNLAVLLRQMDDFPAAKPLFERALHIFEMANGPEHSTTGVILNGLAIVLQGMGDYSAAKPLFERALAISENAEGPDHPKTATRLENLAGLLWAMGDVLAAKPLYERALAVCEKTLGSEHPQTKAVRRDLESLP